MGRTIYPVSEGYCRRLKQEGGLRNLTPATTDCR